jgi:rare lipoprotein A
MPSGMKLRIPLLLAALLLAAGCAHRPAAPEAMADVPVTARDDDAGAPSSDDGADKRVAHVQRGVASYVGAPFEGRRTASGAIFDGDALEAAHRTLPFGTRVRVTNLANHRSVVVTVVDRGPFHAGRVIDLSRRAARQLDFVRAGTASVRLEVLADRGGDDDR